VSGFAPTRVPADIADALAARAGRLGGFASRLVCFETVSSTNDEAARLAAGGAAHGTVVVADAQQSGRGRMGRTWFSPPGAGLYVSVVLRPGATANPAEAGSHVARRYVGSGFSRTGGGTGVSVPSAVTLTAGVAVAEAIRAATGLPVAIKWPNDLVVERRKLCGILAEASATDAGLRHVVLGYGINVRPAAYPPDIADRATSLETELGRPVDRAEVLAETLARLAECLGPGRDRKAGDSLPDEAVADTEGLARMLERWRALSPSSSGAPVEVVQADIGWVPGTTAGIDADGALLVAVDGTLRRVIAGEVRWM